MLQLLLKMKVLFLCAGYGTRLENDLRVTGQYPEFIGRPKALLPIREEKALLSFWMDAINNLENITEVIIVSNDKFTEQFYKSRRWYAPTPDFKLTIVNDGSTSNETRLGAVADIKFGLKDHKEEDVLVIAGDTLFKEDFCLKKFIQRFEELKKNNSPLALIAESPCPEDEVHKHGIIEVADEGRVTKFLEKPQHSETTSRSQSPCFYLFDTGSLTILDQFLESTKNLSIDKRDATGHFLAFLIPKAAVFAFKTKGRFDVGNLASYQECVENYVI